MDMRMMHRSQSNRFLFSSFIFFAPCFAMAALLAVPLVEPLLLLVVFPSLFYSGVEAAARRGMG